MYGNFDAPIIYNNYSLSGVSEKEEKSKLKQLYIEFYQQLVEAVSDPDTCRCLTTQLHSTSHLFRGEKSRLSSVNSPVAGQVLSNMEKEPHLVTVLMEKMSLSKTAADTIIGRYDQLAEWIKALIAQH